MQYYTNSDWHQGHRWKFLTRSS